MASEDARRDAARARLASIAGVSLGLDDGASGGRGRRRTAGGGGDDEDATAERARRAIERALGGESMEENDSFDLDDDEGDEDAFARVSESESDDSGTRSATHSDVDEKARGTSVKRERRGK